MESKKEISKLPEFEFKTTDFVYGIVIHLIDNNPYSRLVVDVWFNSLYTGLYEVPHYVDINDDHLGRDTSIFRTEFSPFRTSGTIKIIIKTNLLYNDKIKVKLLTKKENLTVYDKDTTLNKRTRF